jgi:hypothetical protein
LWFLTTDFLNFRDKYERYEKDTFHIIDCFNHYSTIFSGINTGRKKDAMV